MKFAQEIASVVGVQTQRVYRLARRLGIKKRLGMYFFTEAQAKTATTLLNKAKARRGRLR
jgi:hypothetical protein